MLHLIFAFLIGVLLLQLWETLPNLWITSSILVALGLVWRFSSCRWTRNLFKVSTIIVFGFWWVLVRAYAIDSWQLPEELEGKKLVIIGYVASLPNSNPLYTRFVFDVLSINGQGKKTKLRINWHGSHPVIEVGDKWQLEVKLKRPHGVFNPGGFDFEKYLFQRGIRSTGYVVSDGANQFLESTKYHYFLDRVRQLLRTKVMQSLVNKSLGSIINTLIIGDQGDISKAQWQVFRDTGTSYLMAISGLHINFFAFLAFASSNFLWRRWTRLTLWMPASQAAAIASFMAALVYSALSGFSIPTQRALIMLAVFTGALLLRRNIKSWDILFLALFIVLLIDPLAVLSEGFWLSFVAVGLILFVTKGRLQLRNSWWREYCRIQWGITLGLMPFTLLWFQQVSMISLVASALALPAVCLVIIPLSLIGGLILLINTHYGGYFLWVAEKIMELVWLWLQWLSSFAWLNWWHPIFNWWVFAASLVGIILLLAPRGFPSRWLGIIWLLPLFFYKPSGPKYGEIWFTLLDVGQGLAGVVRTQNHIIVYDTGSKSIDSDAGETVVVPFLRALGVSNLNAMVVSHGDDDHIGGADSILAAISVQRIMTSVPEQFLSIKAEYCLRGQAWSWDGVDFSFINSADKLFSGNDGSCVLRIDNGVNSILLVGDIERPAENWLINNELNRLVATILVAPHHGSKTSSSPKFIEAVNAKYVLFPIGYRNRFRFPSKVVVRRYLQKKAKLFDTAQSGAITFKLGKESFVADPLLYRVTNRHYWNFDELSKKF
jgi:competence protein ComEC